MAFIPSDTGFKTQAKDVKQNIRGDIQGLRALSVIVIVLFHLDLNLVPGGYVGVDTFMVISGFLITGSLLSEKVRTVPARRYFLPFWDRRIRRLFPALLLMLVLCYCLGWVSLRPVEYENFATASLFTLFYTINFHLTAAVDYFAADASMNYLLHTWSLAVEEQFYILLPIVLFLLRPSRSLGRWFAAFWLTSFALGISSMILSKGETYAFYLLPTRAWEFVTGGLIAIYSVRAPQSAATCTAFGGIGLVLIALSITLFDEFTPFPGAAALVPVVGTALVILSGTARAGTDSPVHRALGWVPMRWIGDMSYSIYLIHWPVIVFARHFYGEERLSTIHAPGLILLILSLSWVSWRFVETPFRSPNISARRFYSTIIASILLVVGFALGVIGRDGFPQRVEPKFQEEPSAEQKAFGAYKLSCNRKINTVQKPEDLCVFGSANAPKSLFVWGDSHASALIAALHEFGVTHNVSGRMATLGGCAPVPSFAPGSSPYCSDVTAKVLALVLDIPEITTVILHARWPNIFGTGPFGSQRIKSAIHATTDEYYRQPEVQKLLVRNLTEMIRTLQRAGKKVIIVGPVPEAGLHAMDAAWTQSFFGVSSADFYLSREAVDARQAPVVSALQSIHQETSADLLLPTPLYCDEDRCEITEGNIPGARVHYNDSDHLSAIGARRIAEEIYQRLKH